MEGVSAVPPPLPADAGGASSWREPEPLQGPDKMSTRRMAIISFSGLVASLLIAVLTVFPSAFAIGGPGPTFDTLSNVNGTPLVEISGAPTFPASGELRLTTVSVSRAGSQPFTLGRVLAGWASPREYVLPEEYVFGSPDQATEVKQQAQSDWITSQESATVAALEELGTPVPATIRVAAVMDSSNAKGKLEKDDMLVAINGKAIVSYSDLTGALHATTPGDDVTVTVTRAGQRLDETFATKDDGTGRAIMGIYVDPTFDIPIDVTVQIDSVGGPSAGLMFSLGIMDKLTAKDELGGAKVAGTGTIDAGGDVGPIGGIRMKLFGARDAGAKYFLAPVENCKEVAGHIPAGLSVFSVDTLHDAYNAIEHIGAGDTADLPTC